MWQTFRQIIFWDFKRTAWQYDLLCILIVAFIFLTPKSWFDSKEQRLTPPEISKNNRLYVSPDIFSPEIGENKRLQIVRQISGNSTLQIVGYEKKLDVSGNVIAYEVETR